VENAPVADCDDGHRSAEHVVRVEDPNRQLLVHVDRLVKVHRDHLERFIVTSVNNIDHPLTERLKLMRTRADEIEKKKQTSSLFSSTIFGDAASASSPLLSLESLSESRTHIPA